MSRKLFVAGPSAIRLKVRDIIDACTSAGWEITNDWTRSPEWESAISTETLKAANAANFDGVLFANVVLWVCDDRHPSAGAAWEAAVGYLALKPVIVLWLDKSRYGAGSCYALDCKRQCRTVDEVLEQLESIVPAEAVSHG